LDPQTPLSTTTAMAILGSSAAHSTRTGRWANARRRFGLAEPSCLRLRKEGPQSFFRQYRLLMRYQRPFPFSRSNRCILMPVQK
jgi:hypothetical protein